MSPSWQRMLLVFFPVLYLTGCVSQASYPVFGNVKHTTGWKPSLYLVMPRHFTEIAADFQGQVLDSAAIAPDGSFYFTENALPSKRTLLLLVAQKQDSRYNNHLEDEFPPGANYMPMLYEPGKAIEINGTVNAFFKSCQFIKPSPANRQLADLRNVRLSAHEAYERSTHTMHDDSTIIEKEKAHARYTSALTAVADTTAVPEVAFVAIRWASPTNDFERIPEFITRQCNRWRSTVDLTAFTESICALAHPAHLPLLIGDTLPDFRLPLHSGDTAALHTLLGSRLTILDLWASWCAPCRKENREILRPLLERHRDQGLQIIGYALDSDDAAWKKAIQKDQATWVHASHLAGDGGPFVEALRITTIPANYILDDKGVILARNLHGADLEKWLSDILR